MTLPDQPWWRRLGRRHSWHQAGTPLVQAPQRNAAEHKYFEVTEMVRMMIVVMVVVVGGGMIFVVVNRGYGPNG